MPDSESSPQPSGSRHIDRASAEEELATRLEQLIDGYVMRTGKPKSFVFTTMIDILDKKKRAYDLHSN